MQTLKYKRVTITGIGVEGEILTATVEDSDGTTGSGFTYQWMLAGVDVGDDSALRRIFSGGAFARAPSLGPQPLGQRLGGQRPSGIRAARAGRERTPPQE